MVELRCPFQFMERQVASSEIQSAVQKCGRSFFKSASDQLQKGTGKNKMQIKIQNCK